jgi:hypothetical protein
MHDLEGMKLKAATASEVVRGDGSSAKIREDPMLDWLERAASSAVRAGLISRAGPSSSESSLARCWARRYRPSHLGSEGRGGVYDFPFSSGPVWEGSWRRCRFSLPVTFAATLERPSNICPYSHQTLLPTGRLALCRWRMHDLWHDIARSCRV